MDQWKLLLQKKKPKLLKRDKEEIDRDREYQGEWKHRKENGFGIT